MEAKDLLKTLGEETLHSAKGHFKACDIRRNLITFTIWAEIVLTILSMINFSPAVDKGISVTALLGFTALLIWNEGEGKDYRARHKEIGEQYLALHKEIRVCFSLDNCNPDQVRDLSERVIELDQSKKLEIPIIARKWAKRSIEGKDPETTNWFKESKNT